MKRRSAIVRRRVRAGRREARARVLALLLCLPLVMLSACAEIPGSRVGESGESGEGRDGLPSETELTPHGDGGDAEREEVPDSPPEEPPPVAAETETPPEENVPEGIDPETDPETDAGPTPAEALTDAGFGEILLYAVGDDMFGLPRTQVPYYEAGEVVFQTEAFFQQCEREDQLWRGDPLRAAFVLCRNLLGNQQDILCADETVSGDELTTRAGLTIRVMSPADGAPDRPYTAEMTAPGLGQYRVTMEYMAGTSVLYVREIVFLPRISKNSAYADILIYSLGDDAFYNRPRTQVPEYVRGELQFNTEEFFQSHSEGHQPWRESPLQVVYVLCWNLLGDRIQEFHVPGQGPAQTAEYSYIEGEAGYVVEAPFFSDSEKEGKERYGHIEMTVPDLGKYVFYAENRGDLEASYTKRIIFTPD